MKKWDVIEEEKIEKENSRVREFLARSLPKKAAAVGLAAVLALGTLTFGGCASSKSGENNTPEISQVQQTEKEETTAETEIIQKPIVEDTKKPSGDEKKEVPVSTIEGFVENLRQNFVCTVTKDGVQTNYVVDDGVVKVQTADATTIYASDESGNYVYSLLESGDWQKDFAQAQYNHDAILYDVLSRTTWNAYDEESNTFTGTVDGNNITFKIDGANATISSEILMASVSEVGSANISLPESDNVVDKTVPQKFIYENGDYDIVLIKEVLEDWMKGNNQWGKDVLAHKAGNDGYKTQEIIYIKPLSDRLEFGLIMNRSEDVYYYVCYIEDAKLLSMFESSDVQEEDFKEYLNSILPKTLRLNAEQPQIDTTITQTEFEKMTTNVFQKLTNKGVQNGGVSVDAPETKLPNFDKAEIIYGFKQMPVGRETADATFGYKKSWDQYYIIEYNGKIEMVRIHVVSSTYNSVKDENQNVINNTDGWWYVHSIKREELDKENAQIHESENTQMISTLSDGTKKVQEINKELL